MGKIFTINIVNAFYRHKALVSILYLQEETFFHIQLIDPNSREIFQLDHIRYKGLDGYKNSALYTSDLSGKLLGRMANAIEQKLMGKTAIIRSLSMPPQ